MRDLKELEVIETALVSLEFSSHGFNLSPDIDKSLRSACVYPPVSLRTFGKTLFALSF